MKNILIVFFLLLVSQFWLFSREVMAIEVAGSSARLIDKTPKKDERIKKLSEFFKNYKSPLAEYSAYFIQSADKYGIDWRLLPAISGVESTFGKQMIKGSYNAYGWGGGRIYFKSWEESIEKVSKALAEKYYARGLDNPYKIAPVYCPPSKVWANNVTYFMNKLEQFSKENSLKTLLTYSF